MQHFLKDLTIMLSQMAFHAADNHRATSEGAARFVTPHTRSSLPCVSATVERCFHQLQKLQQLCGFPSPLRAE
jgi:hypothetical protein